MAAVHGLLSSLRAGDLKSAKAHEAKLLSAASQCIKSEEKKDKEENEQEQEQEAKAEAEKEEEEDRTDDEEVADGETEVTDAILKARRAAANGAERRGRPPVIAQRLWNAERLAYKAKMAASNPGPYRCPFKFRNRTQCDEKRATWAEMEIHVLVHGYRLCGIPTCGKMYTGKHELAQHCLTHYGDPYPFKCPMSSCTYAASSLSNTRKHVKRYHPGAGIKVPSLKDYL